MSSIGFQINLANTSGLGVANLAFSSPFGPQFNAATVFTGTSTSEQFDGFGTYNFALDFFDGGAWRFHDVSFDLTGATFNSASSVLKFVNGFDAASHIWTPVVLNGNNVTGFAAENASGVPLPPSALLLGSGLLGLVGFGWRRKRG
jgi:hypothetical protein